MVFPVSAPIFSGYYQLNAGEYYVAPATSGASDNNPGTLTQPWKSISKGALSAEIKVPANAKRMRALIGLALATGTLLPNDISVKVR